MTKERTKEDWEHEGWIVGDGSLVGEERAGVYDVYREDDEYFWRCARVATDDFHEWHYYKLVRPLPKLPESGCADRANALDSARDKLLHGHSLCDFCGREHTHFKNLGGKQKCPMCTIDNRPKPIEPEPGDPYNLLLWATIELNGIRARFGGPPNTDREWFSEMVERCWSELKKHYGDNVGSWSGYLVDAEAPSPEGLIK